MKTKLILPVLIAFAVVAVVAQEIELRERSRPFNSVPAGLRNAIGNLLDNLQSQRTNAVQIELRIHAVLVPGVSTNISLNVIDLVRFREQ